MTDERLLNAEKKFSRLLKEIFQFDCADLDFGIYRILAMKQTGLETYLDQELLPQVRELLATAAGDRGALAEQLAKLEETFRNTGMTEEEIRESRPWKKLNAKQGAAPDVAALGREVFSDLTTFFSRYWYEDKKEADAFFERDMPNPDVQPLFDEARRLRVGFHLG